MLTLPPTLGLLTTGWKLSGTNTLRKSSAKLLGRPPDKESGWGGNEQNISDRLRRVYRPSRPGYKLVQCDQAGAEALLVAYLCTAGNFRALFDVGIKPHVYVALHVFASHWAKLLPKGERIEDYTLAPIRLLPNLPSWRVLGKAIKEHHRYYAIGKMICHASNYGMRPPTFQLNVLQRSEGKIVLTLAEAAEYLRIYHQLFPEITLWHVDVEQQLRATRTLANLFGFPRYFGGPFGDKLWKEAYAFVPQSTVGCITSIAYVNMQTWIEENPEAGWNLLTDTHDSILLECPEEDVPIASRLAKLCIEQELVSPRGEVFNMRSEVGVGTNWSKYNEEENPGGLKEYQLAA